MNKQTIVRVALLCVVLVCGSAAAYDRSPERCPSAIPVTGGFGAVTPDGSGGKLLCLAALEDYKAAKGESRIPDGLRAAFGTRRSQLFFFRADKRYAPAFASAS